MVWHYTKGIHLPKILEAGFIRAASTFVAVGERPIVWFSTNQHFEWTVGTGRVENGKYIEDTFEETVAKYGLARIGVAPETAPYTWSELKELSGMGQRIARGLVRAATSSGARTHEWRGTFEPVPREKWLAVEVFQDGKWVALAEADGATGAG